MPLYEYQCDLCNCMWEELEKFSDPIPSICKGCDKEGGIKRLLPGQLNFILKGRGWANEGYHPDLSKPLVKEKKIINQLDRNIMTTD